MERTLERKLAVIYERNLNNIENEEFIVVDDK